MNNVEPRQIRMLVRRPAGLSRNSRSTPIIPPRRAARKSFSAIDGSMSTDDYRRVAKYKRGQESALRTVPAAQNSFAAGYACRPERSEIDTGQRHAEHKAQPEIPTDVDAV